MAKYDIYITPQAYRDIDSIYKYIHEELLAEKASMDMVDALDSVIMSLDEFPHRGAERKVGFFANRGYRQLFAKNYTIIYRIDEDRKRVVINTVRYSHSSF